jgi:hypothetical protein
LVIRHDERQRATRLGNRAARSRVRIGGNPVRPKGIVTVEGDEAIPLATTTSVLLPAGVPGGRVNLVEDLVPAATDTEVQLLVRA